MVNQTDTMARLNKEREYEDKLVEVLSDFYIYTLDYIDDIDSAKKERISEILTKIKVDSIMHSEKFNMLLQMVLENGEDNY